MSRTAPDRGRQVVFYDGVCGLCNRAVRFLIAVDSKRALSFAPLQGRNAESLSLRHALPSDLDSLVFVENFGTDKERVSLRSTGVARALAHLGGVWRAVSWFRIVPAPIRDWVYDLVARYRYRWFGRFDTCPLPDADVRSRFLT